eukprot:5624578-Prymnesium_polylepis.1
MSSSSGFRPIPPRSAGSNSSLDSGATKCCAEGHNASPGANLQLSSNLPCLSHIRFSRAWSFSSSSV